LSCIRPPYPVAFPAERSSQVEDPFGGEVPSGLSYAPGPAVPGPPGGGAGQIVYRPVPTSQGHKKCPCRPAVSRVLFPPPLGGDGGRRPFVWTRHCWRALPARASGLPAATGPGPTRGPLLGLAPGGVYHAGDVTAAAVRSYRTISPLPFSAKASKGEPFLARRRKAVCFLWHFPYPARPLRAARDGGRYPPPWSSGARTFLPPALRKRRQGAAFHRPTPDYRAQTPARGRIPGRRLTIASGPCGPSRNRKRFPPPRTLPIGNWKSEFGNGLRAPPALHPLRFSLFRSTPRARHGRRSVSSPGG